MSKLALVDHEGKLLVENTPQSQSPEVETLVEEPLWKVAAREAAKQSTKKDTNK